MEQPRDEKGRFCKKTEDKVYAEGFKAFESNLTCKGKQYKENSVFEEPDKCMCKSGMHFCEKPEDLLFYYPLVDLNADPIVFAPVTALAPCDTDGPKSVTTKLHIGDIMGLKSYVAYSVYSIENNKDAYRVEDHKRYSASCDAKTHLWPDIPTIACMGNCSDVCSCFDNIALSVRGRLNSAACTGAFSRIFVVGGDNYVAVSGFNSSIAVCGTGDNNSIAAAGASSDIATESDFNKIAVSGGDAYIYTGGLHDCVSTTGLNSHIKLAGYKSRAVVVNDYSSVDADARDSIAAALGKSSKVRGKRGTMLICVEFSADDTPKATAWGIVDGVNIKEDTWYICSEGKLVEK